MRDNFVEWTGQNLLQLNIFKTRGLIDFRGGGQFKSTQYSREGCIGGEGL